MEKQSTSWFEYYIQLRQYKEALENSFLSLLFKQITGAFASIAIILTLQDPERHCSSIWIKLVGLVATFGLFFWGYLTIKYFLQTRKVGTVMADIETQKLEIEPKFAIKFILSNNWILSIFSKKTSPVFVLLVIYSISLLFAVLSVTWFGQDLSLSNVLP